MIDFIVVGIVILGLMFVVCFAICFVTISISYALAHLARNWIGRLRQAQPALK